MACRFSYDHTPPHFLAVNSSLTKDQLKALGLALAACAFFGVAAWFGWSSLQQALGEAQAVFDRKSAPNVSLAIGHAGGVAKVHQETKELARLNEAARQRLEKTVHTWQQGWRDVSGDGVDWSTDPGKWKDKLIETRSFFMQQSREAKGDIRVNLPEEFYLSLGEFRQKSPSPDAVADLARQLAVARRLVEILVQARSRAKEAYPTPCVLVSLERTDSKTNAVVSTPATPPASSEKFSLPRMTFQMQVDSSPEVLFALMRGLADDPWLFLVQDLLVKNELNQFPSRSEIRKKFEAKDQPQGKEAKASSPKLLEVLAGKEKVQSTLVIEYVGWPSDPGKEPSSQP